MALQTHHIDLVTLGGGLTLEAAANILLHELGIFARHEISKRAADELALLGADESCELLVGVQHHLAVHDDCLVDAVCQLSEELRGGAVPIQTRTRAARQKMVDRGAQSGDLRVVGVQLYPSLQAPADCDALQLMRELLDGAHLTALQPVQHQ